MKYCISLFFLLLVSQGFAQNPNEWEPRGIGGGGALFSPGFNPWAPKELYVPCDMGEVFHSTDLGKGWEAIDFRQVQSQPNAKASFTKNGKTVYTIDGANDLKRPKYSTDGGKTWTFLATDPTSGDAYSIWADPGNENRLLISSYNTLYFSDNKGATFSQKYKAVDNSKGLHIAGVFFDTVNIFVGTNEGLLVSLNHGSIFFMEQHGGIPQGETMVAFAGAEDGGYKRFYCITHSNVYAGIQGHDYNGYRNIFSMSYSGSSSVWIQRSLKLPQGNFPFFLDMARNNLDVFYVAGGSDQGSPVVFKSTDGGINFINVFNTGENANIGTGWSGDGGDRGWSYGEYALGFDVADLNANYVAITDFGFVHVTSDAGTSWNQAYVKPGDQNVPGAKTPKKKAYRSVGLENTTAWQLYWFDSTTMFGCFSDIRGVRSTDRGESWSFNYAGLFHNSMYRIAKDRTRNTWYGAVSSVHDMYQSTYLQDAKINSGTGAVMYTTDKGVSWVTMHDFGAPVVWVATDPTHTNKVYASVVHSVNGGIYMTDNAQNLGTSTWQKLPNPPRTEGHPYNIVMTDDGVLIVTYSGRRDPGGIFTPSSGVFVSTDGGQSWLDRSDPAMHYWTKDIVIDPNDGTQNTWYAGVFSGWGGAPNGLGGLYKTSNRGASWTRVHTADRVTSCTFHPTDPNEMYFTTEQTGLYISHNAQAITPTFSQVAQYPFRQPERVFYDPYKPTNIWVTSFGNGLRVGDKLNTLPPPVRKVTPLSPANKADSIVPNGVTFLWKGDENAKSYALEYASNADFQNSVVVSPIYDTTITIGLADHVEYFWRVRGDNEAGQGSWSNSWSFTTSSRVPAKVFLYVPATGDTNIVSGVYVMKWWPVDTITGYQMEIRKNDTTVKLISLSSTPSTLAPALEYYTWYTWRVRAVKDETYGPWSEFRRFKTAPQPSGPPELVSPMNDSMGVPVSYRVTWKWAERADHFTIHISKTPDFKTLEMADDQIYGTQLNFMYFDPNTKYYWRVRGRNGGGVGAWSDTWSFTTAPAGTVQQEHRSITSFECRPNPIGLSTKLYLDLTEMETLTVIAYTATGIEAAKIASGSYPAGSHVIEWQPRLSAGQYFVRLSTKTQTMTLPVIIR